MKCNATRQTNMAHQDMGVKWNGNQYENTGRIMTRHYNTSIKNLNKTSLSLLSVSFLTPALTMAAVLSYRPQATAVNHTVVNGKRHVIIRLTTVHLLVAPCVVHCCHSLLHQSPPPLASHFFWCEVLHSSNLILTQTKWVQLISALCHSASFFVRSSFSLNPHSQLLFYYLFFSSLNPNLFGPGLWFTANRILFFLSLSF